MEDRFARTRLLLGDDAMEALARAHVIVFGIGGVGGYAAEALARSGIGALTLVDDDTISPTNVNRQVVATTSTIGQDKAQAMAARIADINPACAVEARRCFYLPATSGEFDLRNYDYIVDAMDTVTAKLHLAEQAQAAGTPLISSMGTANKIDPTALQVADISETHSCPFARIIRKECRKRGIKRLKVVYSTEPARHPAGDAALEEGALRPGRRDVPGSTAFVPPAAGLAIAAEVVRELAGVS